MICEMLRCGELGGFGLLIKSMAGDFEISIDRFDTDDGFLVMTGKMGVWDAETYITARDLVTVFSKLIRLKVLVFVLLLPIRLLMKEPTRPTTL